MKTQTDFYIEKYLPKLITSIDVLNSDKRRYSKKLGIYYLIDDAGNAIFEDGVKYTRTEISMIKDFPAPALKVAHTVKRAFSGTSIKNVITES